jgi:hypothetical protein
VDKNNKKSNVSFFKKTLLAVLLSVFLSFFPIKAEPTRACWWSEATCMEAFNRLDATIEGVIMTTLQQQAARIINEQVNKLVGGTVGTGARFITNWESYLVTEPRRQAQIFVNAKIDQSLRGRGSYSSYIPRSFGSVLGASDSKSNEGFFGGKVLGDTSCTNASDCTEDQDCINGTCVSNGSSLAGSGNYYQDMQATAENAVSEEDPQVTYEGDPSQMFSGDTFEPYNTFFSGINSNTMAAEYFKSVKIEKQQQLATMAQVQGQANNGYLSTMRNGMVVTPGATIAQTVANVQDIGNKIIAAAKHPEQIVTAVITNVISKSLQVGIGMVDRQVNQMTDKALNEVNSKVNSFGPGALYNRR